MKYPKDTDWHLQTSICSPLGCACVRDNGRIYTKETCWSALIPRDQLTGSPSTRKGGSWAEKAFSLSHVPWPQTQSTKHPWWQASKATVVLFVIRNPQRNLNKLGQSSILTYCVQIQHALGTHVSAEHVFPLAWTLLRQGASSLPSHHCINISSWVQFKEKLSGKLLGALMDGLAFLPPPSFGLLFLRLRTAVAAILDHLETHAQKELVMPAILPLCPQTSSWQVQPHLRHVWYHYGPAGHVILCNEVPPF